MDSSSPSSSSEPEQIYKPVDNKKKESTDTTACEQIIDLNTSQHDVDVHHEYPLYTHNSIPSSSTSTPIRYNFIGIDQQKNSKLDISDKSYRTSANDLVSCHHKVIYPVQDTQYVSRAYKRHLYLLKTMQKYMYLLDQSTEPIPYDLLWADILPHCVSHFIDLSTVLILRQCCQRLYYKRKYAVTTISFEPWSTLTEYELLNSVLPQLRSILTVGSFAQFSFSRCCLLTDTFPKSLLQYENRFFCRMIRALVFDFCYALSDKSLQILFSTELPNLEILSLRCARSRDLTGAPMTTHLSPQLWPRFHQLSCTCTQITLSNIDVAAQFIAQRAYELSLSPKLGICGSLASHCLIRRLGLKQQHDEFIDALIHTGTVDAVNQAIQQFQNKWQDKIQEDEHKGNILNRLVRKRAIPILLNAPYSIAVIGDGEGQDKVKWLLTEHNRTAMLTRPKNRTTNSTRCDLNGIGSQELNQVNVCGCCCWQYPLRPLECDLKTEDLTVFSQYEFQGFMSSGEGQSHKNGEEELSEPVNKLNRTNDSSTISNTLPVNSHSPALPNSSQNNETVTKPTLRSDEFNLTCPRWMYPLHIAIRLGILDIVKSLVDQGAYVNTWGYTFATPLYIACATCYSSDENNNSNTSQIVPSTNISALDECLPLHKSYSMDISSVKSCITGFSQETKINLNSDVDPLTRINSVYPIEGQPKAIHENKSIVTQSNKQEIFPIPSNNDLVKSTSQSSSVTVFSTEPVQSTIKNNIFKPQNFSSSTIDQTDDSISPSSSIITPPELQTKLFASSSESTEKKNVFLNSIASFKSIFPLTTSKLTDENKTLQIRSSASSTNKTSSDKIDTHLMPQHFEKSNQSEKFVSLNNKTHLLPPESNLKYDTELDGQLTPGLTYFSFPLNGLDEQTLTEVYDGLAIPRVPNHSQCACPCHRTVTEIPSQENPWSKTCNKNIVEYLLDQGSPVDAPDLYSIKCPINAAIKNNNVELLEKLILMGAQINIRSLPSHAISSVIQHSKRHQKKNAPGSFTRLCYKSPLFFACEIGAWKCIEVLLRYGADPHWKDTFSNRSLTPALLAYRKKPEMLQLFLKYNTGRHLSQRWVLSEILSVAILQDDIKAIEQLIELYPDLLECEPDGMWSLPLIQAARLDKVEIVEKLLKYGANPNLYNSDGYTALHLAANEGRKLSLEYLIQNGALINIQEIRHGKTPLHVAVEENRKDVVDSLLYYGPNITIKDSTGRTPLMTAIATRNDKIATILLKCGTRQDLDIVDTVGRSSLMYAIYFGQFKVADALVQRGVNCILKDATGITPESLLKAKINSFGKTPSALNIFLRNIVGSGNSQQTGLKGDSTILNTLEASQATLASNETVRKMNKKRKKIAKTLLRRVQINSKKSQNKQGTIPIQEIKSQTPHIPNQIPLDLNKPVDIQKESSSPIDWRTFPYVCEDEYEVYSAISSEFSDSSEDTERSQ